VRFVGTTLWSDFDLLAVEEGSPAQAAAQRDKAFRAANHYLAETGTTRGSDAFLPARWRTRGTLCQDWLRAQLDTPFDGSTVVVTHFAPSPRSADPRYGHTPGTAAFCNRLESLLARAKLWLHGAFARTQRLRAIGLPDGRAILWATPGTNRLRSRPP